MIEYDIIFINLFFNDKFISLITFSVILILVYVIFLLIRVQGY